MTEVRSGSRKRHERAHSYQARAMRIYWTWLALLKGIVSASAVAQTDMSSPCFQATAGGSPFGNFLSFLNQIEID